MKSIEENIVFERTETFLKVAVMGEIDHHCVKEYNKKIDYEIFTHRPQLFIMELSGVTFMDSSGLGLILGRYRLTKEAGIRFRLDNPNVNVMRIIKLAGCEKMIDIKYERKKNTL